MAHGTAASDLNGVVPILRLSAFELECRPHRGHYERGSDPIERVEDQTSSLSTPGLCLYEAGYGGLGYRHAEGLSQMQAAATEQPDETDDDQVDRDDKVKQSRRRKHQNTSDQ
jgi:hypothetical protein